MQERKMLAKGGRITAVKRKKLQKYYFVLIFSEVFYPPFFVDISRQKAALSTVDNLKNRKVTHNATVK